MRKMEMAAKRLRRKNLALFITMAIIFSLGSGSSSGAALNAAYFSEDVSSRNVTTYYGDTEWLDTEFVHPDVENMVTYAEIRERALAALAAQSASEAVQGTAIVDDSPVEDVAGDNQGIIDVTNPEDGATEEPVTGGGDNTSIVDPNEEPEEERPNGQGNQGDQDAQSGLSGGNSGASRSPVNNSSGEATITLGATNAVDLTSISGLFIIDSNAGRSTFTIMEGSTGAGTINGNILTVNGVGVIKIGLVTAQTNTHAAGTMVVGELTVLMGSGATVGAPTIDERTNNSIIINAVDAPLNGQVVEYSIGVSATEPDDVWQTELTFEELDTTTTFYIFARSAENNLYHAGAWAVSGPSSQPTWVILENDIDIGETLAVARRGTLFISEGVTVSNFGTIHLNEDSSLIIEGELVNSHRVFIDRTADVDIDGEFFNDEGGIIDNHGIVNVKASGELINNGQITNRDRADIIVESLLVNAPGNGALNENGIIYNFSNITINNGGRLVNEYGGFIHNRTSAEIHIERNSELVNDCFTDSIRIQNDGDIYVYLRGYLLNDGRIMNRLASPPTPPGRIFNDGFIVGEGKIEGNPLEYCDEYLDEDEV